jgi:ribosomal protein S4E
MVKVKAYWTRENRTQVTYTHNFVPGQVSDEEAMDLAYAIRDGLRLYGYQAEVIIGTEAAVE